jgi:hypothetical protein
VLALVTGPLIYAALQLTARSDSRPWGHGLHFLIQVFLAFAVTAALMALVTWWRPLTAPRTLPVREEIETTSSPAAKLAGAAVLIGVAAFFVVFR